jgi:hypothetical protein
LAISKCRLENYDQDVKYEMGLASWVTISVW